MTAPCLVLVEVGVTVVEVRLPCSQWHLSGMLELQGAQHCRVEHSDSNHADRNESIEQFLALDEAISGSLYVPYGWRSTGSTECSILGSRSRVYEDVLPRCW